MKDNIANVLEDFEKLAYKILMWVILVPKTVIKVVVDPGFVKGYVRQELASEKGKQFDEYISPMLLYLGVTLLPAVAIYLLPSFGMKVLSPHEDPGLYADALVETERGPLSVNDPALNEIVLPVTGVVQQEASIEQRTFLGHYIEFRAEMKTRADTSNQFHSFRWDVWECGNRDPEFGSCKYDTYYYGEIHDEQSGLACIYGTVFDGEENGNCLQSPGDKPSEQNWSPYFPIAFPEVSIDGERNSRRNLVSDIFTLFYRPGEFETGEYRIDVTAATRSLGNSPVAVETDFMSMDLVTIAWTADFSVNPFSGYSTDVDERYSIFNFLGFNIKAGREGEGERPSLADRLESGETIAFGLGLLLPPLLIAGAIGIFMGSKPVTGADGSVTSKSSISEEALRENFYAQCYYFALVGMAFWAWYYSLNYHTYDIQYRGEWLWIPLAMALVWFVIVQIYAIADELPSKSKVGAAFILAGCIVAMFLVVRLGQAFSYNYDWQRKTAIWSYPGAGLLLLLGVIYVQFIRKRKNKKGGRVGGKN